MNKSPQDHTLFDRFLIAIIIVHCPIYQIIRFESQKYVFLDRIVLKIFVQYYLRSFDEKE